MLLPVLASRRPPFLVRYAVPASILLLLAYSFSLPSRLQMAAAATAAQLHESHRLHYHTSPAGQIPVGQSKEEKESNQHASSSTPPPPPPGHPIEHLVASADKQFRDLLSQETHSLGDAAAAYRKRRGRHPPPGFDRWYQFAADRNVVIVESFWDQIYHDLRPFWALPPKLIQREAKGFDMVIRVRRGKASTKSNWFWTQIWLDLLKTIESELPDMDLALNPMDEPRVAVAWEAVENYVAEADRTLGFARVDEVQQTFQSLSMADDYEKDKEAVRDDGRWETSGSFWELVRRGCSPQSAARKQSSGEAARTERKASGEAARTERKASGGAARTKDDDYTSPHMYYGFVANSSLSSDICHQPDLQGLNGIFIEPLSISTTGTLLPIFGGSKLSVNNDILLPAPMYWSNEERFAGGAGDESDVPWSQKNNKAVWRGVATGGHNRESNWKGFHRHRFVAMNDGGLVSKAELKPEDAPNFALPAASYHLRAQQDGRLGQWVSQWADVGFVDLMCDGGDVDTNKNETADRSDECSYVNDYFSVKNSVSLNEQFRFKFLPDIDGNSFSGRYLAFLRSSGLPIKATLWKEWHDARLIAWKHFVPMDNRFGDWYGIMDFLLSEKGDTIGEKIAGDGKAWAAKVLRKEDMQVYVLRLLLEYARVLDEKRELLGWVGDLR